MKLEEELQNLNNIFKSLDSQLILSLHQNMPSISQLLFQSGFDRECVKVKVKILQLLTSQKQKLNTLECKIVCGKLKVFGLSNNYLLEEGLINVYIDVIEQNSKAKKKNNHSIQDFTKKLLACLEEIIKFFFLNNELKHYRKYKNMLPCGLHQQLHGQNQAMEQKIKERVWSKDCSDLFKEYIKNQEANDQKQLCRVCYKNVNISEIIKHVSYCGRKTYLKEQLAENFQRRLTLAAQLQTLMAKKKAQQDQRIGDTLEKIINFYKSLAKEKMGSKKMAMRYQDKNLSLFFQSQQVKNQNQFVVDIVSEICNLQDKAFCLSKKLQQVESQLNVTDIKPTNNILKHSLDPSLKKYKLMSTEAISDIKQSQRSLKKKNEVEYKICEETEQEQQYEAPIIKKRKVKKKMSVCENYNVNDHSDENNQEKNLRQININNFQILKLLGKGAFGRVYLVRRKKTNDIYALKAIRIDKNWGEHQLQSIKNEYGIYKKIQGDHLVAATFSFYEKNVQFFVLQYMPGGDLSKILEQNIYLEQKDATFYLAEILLAIQHLHQADIVHRDLKPENIVLDAKGHLKLTDFGLSQCRVRNKIQKVLGNKTIQQKERSLKTSSTKKSILKNKNGKKLIGTPDYIAPQIIQGKSLTNPTIDWWSFGVIAYQLLIGCRPFSANSIQQILSNIQLGQIQWPEIGYEDEMISPVSVDLIRSLLKKNYEQRLGFNGVEQIKKHQFFKDVDWENLKNSCPPLLSSMEINEKVEFLQENKDLRRQIEILMEYELVNPLQELRNYVRYDILTAQTLESVKQGANKKQKRIKKLHSIVLNLQKKQAVQYKPAFSSEEQNN